MKLEVLGRGLGDEIMATAFAREAKRAFPEEMVRLEVSRPDVWKSNPWINWGNEERFGTVRLLIHAERREWSYVTRYGAELGIPIVDHTPEIRLTPAELSYDFGVPFDWDRLIVIDPWTAATSRRWPLANWKAFAQVLLDEGWQVAEVGDRDRPQEERAKGGIPCTRTFLRQLEIRETASLIKRAAMYVGSDSGVFHLAAAVGTPQVTLFGPVNWMDLSYWNTTPVFPFSKCCGNINTCNRAVDGKPSHCMPEITVDRLLNVFRLAARRWVSKRPVVRPEQDRLTREQLQAVTGEEHRGW